MECFKNIVHYESTTIISLPCIQLAMLKSCSVWCFSEKKSPVVTWGHGAFGPPPVGGPAPTYPLTRTKKSAIFGFFKNYFCPLNPPPHPNKNNLVQPLEKGSCTLENSKNLAIWTLTPDKSTWVYYFWNFLPASCGFVVKFFSSPWNKSN